MNEEATMSRRGLDPVSRKTRTPGGRKKAGFCVYLAYQLLGPYHVQLSLLCFQSSSKNLSPVFIQIEAGLK